MAIEATDDPEGSTDTEVSVELEFITDPDMGLVVTGRPGQMGVTQQDRVSGGRA